MCLTGLNISAKTTLKQPFLLVSLMRFFADEWLCFPAVLSKFPDIAGILSDMLMQFLLNNLCQSDGAFAETCLVIVEVEGLHYLQLTYNG